MLRFVILEDFKLQKKLIFLSFYFCVHSYNLYLQRITLFQLQNMS